MNLQHEVMVGGSASISVIGIDGVEKEYIDKECKIRSGEIISNTILDSFFTFVTEQVTVSNYGIVKIGTGSGETDLTSNTLNSPYTPQTNWPFDTPSRSKEETQDGFILYANTFNVLFNVGDISGNFSEIGLFFGGRITSSATSTGYDNSKGDHNVHTRLLIKDSEGNPATITVLPEEQLKVAYKLFVKVPKGPVIQNTTISIDGVDHPIEIALMNTGLGLLESIFNYHHAYSSQISASQLYAYGDSVGGEGSIPDYSTNTDQYDSHEYGNENGYKYRDVEWNSESANFSEGIKGIAPSTSTSYYCMYKWSFNPAIPKTSDQRFKFRIKSVYSRA